MIALVCIIALCCVPSIHGSGTGWNYDHSSASGPEEWSQHYPDCGGVMQSPIDVETKHVLHNPELEFFDFSDYHKTDGVSMSLHNVGGHTVEVMLTGSPLLLKGGNLPHEYRVDQFHFHWGKKDSRGSEHAVDGKHFPMEMHIVHHLTAMADSKAASSHPYGLAVVGFFFEVGDHNPNFENILAHFDAVQLPGNHTDIPTFKLADLLPGKAENNIDFFRYMGSLTTPPCYETVIWSLGTETIKLSEDQINQFRALFQDREGNHLGDDFRPVQNKNHRTVTTTMTMGNGANCNNA